METEFELRRRGMLAYWREIQVNTFRSGRTPDFESSYSDTDPETNLRYVVLKDRCGNVCTIYRVSNQGQLRKLARIPKFMRTTNGQDVPLN
jgi:hypothetical protein